VSTHIQHLTATDRAALSLTEDDLDLDRGADGHVMRHQVMCCSDGHFIQFILGWMSQWFPNDADLIAVPGSGLELCLEPNMRDGMVARARLLHRAHATDEVWCFFHNGCGGYTHHRGHADPERERAEQLMDMAHIYSIYHELGLLLHVQLHFGVMLTRGPGFVPLSQLSTQAHSLRTRIPGLTIPPLERDLREFTDRAARGLAIPLPV
jgi:hypothetical protein